MEFLPYKRMTVEEIQRRRGLNEITTRDRIARSERAIRASWATIARGQRILDRPDPLRDLHIIDEIAAELVDLTRRSSRLHDDGSSLAMIVVSVA
jgi:hypothetical protein